MHCLTGWIPERLSLSSDVDPSRTFKMLESKMRDGSVLVTVATGELSENDASRTGLVPTHAYAVLDVREINGVQLLQLKNPWSHLRWRGNYSELDSVHWTTELKILLDYNPDNAATFDNGVFWIDYQSVRKFFDVIYMNWNPTLFKHSHTIHRLVFWALCSFYV